jgi:acyl-CoA synthetase (AMP-forming)/AMP-acid ligase II
MPNWLLPRTGSQAHLAGRGTRPGQRLAVWLTSRIETAIALLTCSRRSYVCCPSLRRNDRHRSVAGLSNQCRGAYAIEQRGDLAGRVVAIPLSA